MKRIAGAFCAFVLVGSLMPRAAQAAPVTLQFAVNIDQFCDAQSSCQSVALGGETLTLVFDGSNLLYSTGSDSAGFSSHAIVFGPPSMSMSGPLADLPNPFGTVTTDSSYSSLSYVELIGYSATTTNAAVALSHETSVLQPDGTSRDQMWFYQLGIRRLVEDQSGDALTATPTADDLIAELRRGTFEFQWSANIFTRDCPAIGNCNSLVPWVTDPRNFYASGIATAETTPPAVPEPTTLLLLGTGLLATTWQTRRARR